MIPCYVSGKGMHATDMTKDFKVVVIQALEDSSLGFDTRYRFYRDRFPRMNPAALARMVCNPVEGYDPDWKPYLERHAVGRNEGEILAEFILKRDGLFRAEAQAAIYCYDEAGFGSGVNSMRFIHNAKPILGFYQPECLKTGVNPTNFIQLQSEHPEWVKLVKYHSLDEIPDEVNAWLRELSMA